MSFDRIQYTSSLLQITFYIAYGKTFFLFIHFLVLEDYELPKSTSHILSVPLTLKCVRILSWLISFSSTLTVSLMMRLSWWYCSQLTIWQTIWLVATSWARLWVVIWSWKYKNTIREISGNSILHPIMYFYLENHSIFTTDPYRLKAKNINSLIFISTIIKLLMLNIFFYFIDLVLLREKRKQLFVYWCSSPQIFCLK